MKTMMPPATAPGLVSGRMTRLNMPADPAPRPCAACTRLPSRDRNDAYSGSTTKGISTCVMPTITPVKL